MILKAATAAAERSLTQSEVHWRYLWDNMPDKIAEIDLEANILVANKAFMTASSQQEPYKNLYECVPTEYRKDLKLAIHRAHLSGKNQLYEFPKLEANKTIWWSKQIFPIVARNEIKSFLVIVSDVTERKLAYQKIEQQVQERTQVLLRINQELKDEIYTRKQIESALRESEGRYYRLTAISPVGIFRTDMDGRTVYMNERCAEMIGLPMDEALGHGWTKTLHPDDYDRVTRESYYAWENQLAYKTKHRYLHKDGSVIWVVAEFLKESDENGEFKGFVGTLTNITRLLQTEEKLHQHQMELAHHSRLSTVGEMISGIAHEVNQPLSMVVNYTAGCLERLRHEKVPTEIITMMQRVFDQAELAGQIIHRLKEFLKKRTLEKENININLVIHEAINLIKGVLLGVKVELELDLSDALPPVWVDKIQIEQVILNIMHNAVEAMKESKQARPRCIVVKTSTHPTNEHMIQIRISDTGPGIPAEIADKIFDAFFTTKQEGMGVGLSISASIIETHGGRISLDRSAREGASFNIALPVKEWSIDHE